MIEVVRYVAIFFLFAGASGAVVLFRPQIRTGDGSGKGPAASFPGCGSARSDGRRPAVCLSARAFLGRSGFCGYCFYRFDRHDTYVACVRYVYPEFRYGKRPIACRGADAQGFRIENHAGVFRYAGRTGAARPQLSAAQRRTLYSRVGGTRGESMARRVGEDRSGARPAYGAAKQGGAACQRLPLYARFGPYGDALRDPGRLYARVFQ